MPETKQTTPTKEILAKKGAKHVIKLKDGRKIYLKDPDRVTVEVALGHMIPATGESPKYIKAGEVILNTCRVEGPLLLQEDPMFTSACIAASGIIDLTQAELEKL